MTQAAFCTYCRALPNVEESKPFGPDILVFKVAGKIFALTSKDERPPSINLKCEPDRALNLRDRYEDIQPGSHMDKRHWNTLILDSDLPSKLVRELIDHSYQLVVEALPQKVKDNLGGAA